MRLWVAGRLSVLERRRRACSAKKNAVVVEIVLCKAAATRLLLGCLVQS